MFEYTSRTKIIATIVGVVMVVGLLGFLGYIVVSALKKKKENLSYKTPERFAPVYQVPYVKERFSNDFAVPMVAKAQKSATRASPFVGSL
jgi:flagellar basal body-associated protein FliL